MYTCCTKSLIFLCHPVIASGTGYFFPKYFLFCLRIGYDLFIFIFTTPPTCLICRNLFWTHSLTPWNHGKGVLSFCENRRTYFLVCVKNYLTAKQEKGFYCTAAEQNRTGNPCKHLEQHSSCHRGHRLTAKRFYIQRGKKGNKE